MNNQFIKQRADEWAKTIERFEKSGLTQMEFAKQNNLKNHQISYWASRFKKEQNKVVAQKQNFGVFSLGSGMPRINTKLIN